LIGLVVLVALAIAAPAESLLGKDRLKPVLLAIQIFARRDGFGGWTFLVRAALQGRSSMGTGGSEAKASRGLKPALHGL
jgi:hypothetical protein